MRRVKSSAAAGVGGAALRRKLVPLPGRYWGAGGRLSLNCQQACSAMHSTGGSERSTPDEAVALPDNGASQPIARSHGNARRRKAELSP
jgi:hypothetical protein